MKGRLIEKGEEGSQKKTHRKRLTEKGEEGDWAAGQKRRGLNCVKGRLIDCSSGKQLRMVEVVGYGS